VTVGGCFYSALRKIGWLAALGGIGSLALADEGAPSSDSLSEVVVTAQKRTERLQDVPISISALSEQDLARAGVAETRDLPSMVSGLVWSNQGAWVQPNLRGVSTNVAAVGAPSPIAIYLDGVYQPLQAGTIMDLADVSRIEVLKGPQGTLFGRNATGGAISIFTLDPSFTPTGKISLSGGAYEGGAITSGHYNANGFLSGPLIDDTLAGSVSAYYDRTDGYYINDVSGDRGGEINAAVVRGKLLWKPSDDVKILTTAFYTHRDDGAAEAGFPFGGLASSQFYPDAIIPTKPWHYAYDGPVPTANVDGKGASIKATVDFDEGTLTSITGYSNYAVLAVDDAQASYSPDCIAVFACIAAPIRTHDEAWSQEYDFASKQLGRFRYVAGLFGFYNKPTEHDSYNNNVYFDDTTIENVSYAAFAEGTVDVTDQFSAVAGLRVNHDSLKAWGSYFGAPQALYADKGWTSSTPRVSLIYKFNPILNTYFTYSQGFKAGVVSGQANPAPPASPEKISAYELGLKAAQDRYSLDLATFFYDYRDLQAEVFDTELATVPLNAARARIIGIDLDSAVKLTPELELRLVTTYLPKAEYTSFPNAIAYVPPLTPFGFTSDSTFDATGTRMLVTPLWTGTLSGTYTKQLTAGVIEATGSVYHSNSYRWEYTGTLNTSAYDLLNAHLSFSPTGSQFRYSLYGKNLSNKAYIQGALPSPYSREAILAPPREVGVTLEYSF
jgi:iron complex outermembrane receptor protein